MVECIADPVSEHPLAVNVLKGPTHSRTLQERTSILRFHHSDIDRARKGPFFSDMKS